jgi:hypothetical protein
MLEAIIVAVRRCRKALDFVSRDDESLRKIVRLCVLMLVSELAVELRTLGVDEDEFVDACLGGD